MASTGTVTFLHGETSKYISVPLIADGVAEAHYETFTVYLGINNYESYKLNPRGVYVADVSGRGNATVFLYDWGPSSGGSILASSSFLPSSSSSSFTTSGWDVIGNTPRPGDLWTNPSNTIWTDTHGLNAVDLRYGPDEYNDRCDYASPDGICSYSCQYGKRALALALGNSDGETFPSAVAEFDGKGYVAGMRPLGGGGWVDGDLGEELGEDIGEVSVSFWVRGSRPLPGVDTSGEVLFSYTGGVNLGGGDGDEYEDGFHQLLISDASDLSLMIHDRVILTGDRYDSEGGGGSRRGIKLGVRVNDDEVSERRAASGERSGAERSEANCEVGKYWRK